MSADRILVVDDEGTLREVIRSILEERGCEVRTSESAEDAFRHLESSTFAVALLDIVLPGMNGLQLMARIRHVSPDTEILIMTSHSSVETAIEAIRQGAYNYLQKPFDDIEDVWLEVSRALEKRSLALKNRQLLQDQSRRNQELSGAVMRLTSLMDAGRALAEIQPLPELLDCFLGLVVDELEVDRASLMLVDHQKDELRIAASRGVTTVDVESVRIPVGQGIAGRVAATGEALLVKDTGKDSRSNRDLKPHVSESFICAPIALGIPIKFQGRVLGVISITNRRTGEPFGEDDLSYLSSMSGQLAVAILRATHLQDLQKAYEDLKAAQEQLVISERSKAIGQMAAGVAHDFNNALSGILGNIELLKMKVNTREVQPEDLSRDLDRMEKLSLQAAETIKRIQNFTRIGEDLSHAAVDLNTLIRETVEMTRPKWKGQCEAEGREIDIRFELGEDVGKVAGNEHEIGQLFSNLIFNAVEAMPRGGQVTFRTFREGDWIVTEVTDTGKGMSKKVQERLFEPFFTTKETGQGLGTTIIYAIIARHGGDITVSSQEGKGTAFRVTLPPFSMSDEELRGGDSEGVPPRSAKVLFIEDDQAAREVYEEFLAVHGHDVVAVETGKQAIDLFDDGRFDLVITDLSMPGMSGLEVARLIKSLNGEVPVILLSGWASQLDRKKAQDAGVDQILTKPCPMKKLLEAVNQAVRSRALTATGDVGPSSRSRI